MYEYVTFNESSATKMGLNMKYNTRDVLCLITSSSTSMISNMLRYYGLKSSIWLVRCWRWLQILKPRHITIRANSVDFLDIVSSYQMITL